MRTSALVCAAVSLVAFGAACRNGARPPLTCMAGALGPVEAGTAEETARLRRAPHRSGRPAAHELRVGWSGGQRVFRDEPPYAAEPGADGVRWVYCGYDGSLGYHLIGKADADGFSGTLLDDRSGSLLPGGLTVLFAPNRTMYLSSEQPDGQYGETLTLRSRGGAVLWNGYGGFLAADGSTVPGLFENLHWGKDNRLIASVEPSGKQRMTVALTRRANGKWEWVPAARR